MPFHKHWSQLGASRGLTRRENDFGASKALGVVTDDTNGAEEQLRRSAMSDKKQYLNTEEAAEILRISARTMERYRVQGTGPRYLKVGPGKRARVLYRLEDLIAFLEDQGYRSTSEY